MTAVYGDVYGDVYGGAGPGSGTPPGGPAQTTPWHFLYGPPQPTGGWTGEFVQAQSRTLTMRSGPTNYHQADLNINGRDPVASDFTELENDIQVLYGDQLLFAGRIVPTQDTLDASQHRVTVTALDYREVLRRRYMASPLSFTGQDVGAIAYDMIQTVQGYPSGDLGIVQGIGAVTGTDQTYTTAAGDYCGQDIDTVAQMTPGQFDWDITPYGPADLRLDVFVNGRGTDRGVILEYGGALVSSMTRVVDPSTYADAVYVTGDSSVSLTPQNLVAAGIGAQGRWDSVIGTTLLTSQSLVAYAQYALANAEYLAPTYTVVLHPGVWSALGGLHWIWLGDTVTLRIQSGRLNVDDPLPVSEIDFDISPDGLETVTLTLGPVPWRLYQQIPRMLRRIGNLESR